MDTAYDLTVALTYYSPYISGLTHTARCVAEGMAERGWRVAVIAAQHDRSLPRRETIAGVDVYRAPVLMRVSRGFIAPRYPVLAARLARRSAVLLLNLPMAEAAMVAAARGRTPVVSMVHIDLYLPPGRLSRMLTRLSDRTARTAIRRSAAVVAYSADQAHSSALWPTIRQRRFTPIPAPCLDRRHGQPRYRETPALHVGFLGRVVEEKGIQYLVRAFKRIPDPRARLLIGGDHRAVAGGSSLATVRAEIADDTRIRILGELRGAQVNDFYASIDVFALPSVAESFGIVQAEAMMCGIPSVTTDLPGGRYPVLSTGFGRLVPPRDPIALEKAILELSGIPQQSRELKAKEARERFSISTGLDAFEAVLNSVRGRSTHA
jgi:glycosyltransferase involved in cell wall biosynthesis